MKKILGIDYGTKRIGLAISDGLKTISVPLETIEGKKTLKETITHLEKVLGERLSTIESFVVGLPLHLSGQESSMSQTCREFANALEEHFGKKVFLVDERFSSAQVDSDLRRLGVKRKKREKHLDSASACLVLQNFLDQLGN